MKSQMFKGFKNDLRNVKKSVTKIAEKATLKVAENKGERNVKAFQSTVYSLLYIGTKPEVLTTIINTEAKKVAADKIKDAAIAKHKADLAKLTQKTEPVTPTQPFNLSIKK